MNTQLESLELLCKTLRLNALPPTEFLQDLPDGLSPLDILNQFLELQHQHKQGQAAAARIKKARFPKVKTFDEYDFRLQEGVSSEQMKRLCEFI